MRGREELESTDELLAAAITGGVTSFLTTPLDLVKTRLMMQVRLLPCHFPTSAPFAHNCVVQNGRSS